MTPRVASVPVETPWVDVEIDGLEYQIQTLGCEEAFALDGDLLHLLGEGLAASLGAGLEGILPALLQQVQDRFASAQTMEAVQTEIQRILDLQVGDIEVREYIGRLVMALAPRVADLVRETIPTVASRINGAQARDLVRLVVLGHLKARTPDGLQWYTVTRWPDLDAVLARVERGPRRQMHKWKLLIRAIQVTWGPSGAADPTTPGDERPNESGA
jgi:hypothetical protein